MAKQRNLEQRIDFCTGHHMCPPVHHQSAIREQRDQKCRGQRLHAVAQAGFGSSKVQEALALSRGVPQDALVQHLVAAENVLRTPLLAGLRHEGVGLMYWR